MPYIHVNHKKLFYLDEGEGPVLLFGHSFLWDHRMWRKQVAVLKQQYRCIVPDLWGHGYSDTLGDGPVTLESLADDFLALMDALDVRTFSIIGLSVGGMWGAELAAKAPGRVNALALMDTSVAAEPEESKQRYFAMLDTVESANCLPPAMIDALKPIFFSAHTMKNNPALAAEFKELLAFISENNIATIVKLGRAIFSREDRLAALAGFQMPTLILCGECDQPRPPSEARLMAEQCRHAVLEIIPLAGHIVSLEAPELVNQTLIKFLDEVYP